MNKLPFLFIMAALYIGCCPDPAYKEPTKQQTQQVNEQRATQWAISRKLNVQKVSCWEYIPADCKAHCVVVYDNGVDVKPVSLALECWVINCGADMKPSCHEE